MLHQAKASKKRIVRTAVDSLEGLKRIFWLTENALGTYVRTAVDSLEGLKHIGPTESRPHKTSQNGR